MARRAAMARRRAIIIRNRRLAILRRRAILMRQRAAARGRAMRMRQQRQARHRRMIIIRRQAVRWIHIARRQHWYQAGHNYAWWANARHRHALRVRMLRQRNARNNRIRIMRIRRARMIRMRRMQIIRQRKIAVMKRRAQHWITIARRQGWYRAGLSWTFWSNARAVQNLRTRWTAVRKAQQ